ncbi:Polyketide cyclase / dehydrase and lipid transport [Halobacillus karajensis]|uniref:Polyketide cyclase / dehydrase and lipid transport n=1 Tax=Halobacillus karajensis TaxID=195088 RepID=A0A024P7A8_9BACI|nr:SRPBCC family protein [Halobacillus karajensis]CDQ17806.1 Polyketide cyclase / dehydrase and lipid transport [Halobacillus karajensis]CDQ24212.1 Polyketide cyclase / dehydrase and lipid transport [Halobacillus karajensis]CDQ29539.1 Polyketide cyclase / dehydrase and lipid transport [Halobacillus karajensis]SEH63501.1 Polyketide cyclase / dehydrase and lipid transport [Halobacillus karajensis]
MIQWENERIIHASIEEVWELFRDYNIKRIMPKVEEHELIEKSETTVGAKHRQTYREGKRLETYTVETLDYEDSPERKYKEIAFVIGRAFEVTASFKLVKIDDNRTRFVYAGQNKGVNFIGKAMMKLANKKGNERVVEEFLDRVENEATRPNV